MINKQELILLALSGEQLFSPVQIQKHFFLIDKNISSRIGGPFFNFVPYDYGPFDKSLYEELKSLASKGLVDICMTLSSPGRYYKLSAEGQIKAAELSATQDKDVLEYIGKLSDFVRSLSFGDLVSAIYKAYPEMKVNSVFSES
jgi:hypothetical protein